MWLHEADPNGPVYHGDSEHSAQGKSRRGRHPVPRMNDVRAPLPQEPPQVGRLTHVHASLARAHVDALTLLGDHLGDRPTAQGPHPTLPLPVSYTHLRAHET